MIVEKIFSTLVAPKKETKDFPVTEIPLTGDIYEMISKLLIKSQKECTTPIIFKTNNQNNPIRNAIVDIINNQSEESIQNLFLNLSKATPLASGDGLCFFVIANIESQKIAFITRFPTEEAMKTTISRDEFKIELIKDIYIKSSKAYKAVLFSDSSLSTGFWKGKIIDKQINDTVREVSEYWLYGFLQADFEITSKTGTSMLAKGIKKAIQTESELETKQQLLSVATILSNMAPKNTSIKRILSDLSVTDKVRDSVVNNLENRAYIDSNFEFSKEEFRKNAVYKSIYLDNGGILTAETTVFDECFNRELLDVSTQKTKYSTVGVEIDVKVKSR